MTENTNDHDLLIELRTELRGLRTDVKDIRDNTSADIAMLKKDKADRAEVDSLQKKLDDNIESRMRKVEDWAIEPAEHQRLLEVTNTVTIYLKWLIVSVVALLGLMSWHIIGIKIP
jgi:hypothetical protein